MVSALLGLGLNLDREAASYYQRQLVAALLKAASPSALVYLETVAEQAPPDWDLGPEIATFRRQGIAAPAWGGRPQLRFLGAWKGTELLGDHDLFVLGFMYDGAPLATSFQLMIDNNLAILKDAIELPLPPPKLVDVWREGTDEVTFRPVDAQQASNEVAAALEHSDVMWMEPPWSDDFRSHRGLLRSRLRLLPPAQPADQEVPSEEVRQSHVTTFMKSGDATSLPDTDLAELIASKIVDFRAELGDGEIYRWSPIIVEHFLADWYPRKIVPDAGEVDAVPGVVRAWIRHSGRRRRMPTRLVEETLQAVDEWLPEFRAGMSDSRRHGPAKAILRRCDPRVSICPTETLCSVGWTISTSAPLQRGTRSSHHFRAWAEQLAGQRDSAHGQYSDQDNQVDRERLDPLGPVDGFATARWSLQARLIRSMDRGWFQ
jgi:hypothetical protein